MYVACYMLYPAGKLALLKLSGCRYLGEFLCSLNLHPLFRAKIPSAQSLACLGYALRRRARHGETHRLAAIINRLSSVTVKDATDGSLLFLAMFYQPDNIVGLKTNINNKKLLLMRQAVFVKALLTPADCPCPLRLSCTDRQGNPSRLICRHDSRQPTFRFWQAHLL